MFRCALITFWRKELKSGYYSPIQMNSCRTTSSNPERTSHTLTEIVSFKDQELHLWRNLAANRVEALLICRQALTFSEQGSSSGIDNTILTFIETQRASNTSLRGYFPSQSGCTRIVGLTYGTNESSEATSSSDAKNVENNLTTKRYQQHSMILKDAFSKVMIELPRIKKDRNELLRTESIHNPFPSLCGWNGRHSSGQDFMGSVLKVAHYVGSVESWLERGFGKGTNIRKQDISEWRKRNLKGAPYIDEFDTRMSSWYKKFEAKVGKEGAEELLLQPIQARIEYVRTEIQRHQNMNDLFGINNMVGGQIH